MNTVEMLRELRSGNLDQQQAEAIAHAIESQDRVKGMAADIAALRADTNGLLRDVGILREEMKGGFTALREEAKGSTTFLRAEIQTYGRTLIALGLAILVAAVRAAFFK